MMQTKNSWMVFLAVVSLALLAGYYRASFDGPVSGHPVAEAKLNAERIPLRQTKNNAVHEVRREAAMMGSHFVFVVDAPEEQALAAIVAASDRIKTLEDTISSWRPGSDISRLNESAGIRPVTVSTDTMTLLKISKQVSMDTGGAFDVTIGPLWNLWPFANKSGNHIPTDQEIAQKKSLVDSRALILDEEKGTAFLAKKDMYVNLGAIGKGYAAEAGIREMRARGIQRAAISAGGDIYLLGRKRSGPWVVDIENPRWEGRSLERFISGDIAIATSGDAKQFVMQDGKRYGHILNPLTGKSADQCQSVTIVTQSPTLADAYATAVFVMGPVAGLAWVEKRKGVQALIVDADGIRHVSRGWDAMVREGDQHE